MANILAKRIEWLHRPGETNTIYLDLSRQVQATGATDIITADTIQSATVSLSTLKGDDTASPLQATTPTVTGTGDKLNVVLRTTLTNGIADSDKLIVFVATWVSGAILKYEGVIRVR